MKWTTKDIPDLRGKTAIVTGANTGIGYEIAKALYAAGASVTLAARDTQKAKEAVQRITREASGPGSLNTGHLDLASLAGIRSFAGTYIREHAGLDILVNNAGVMIPPASLTAEGFELQFGVNFLGHFALTAHLFPLLKKAPSARVVTLTSGAATLTEGIDFGNLKLEKPYDAWHCYAVSKLACVLFAYELDRRARAAGLPLLSLAAHPGVTRTDLQRHIPGPELSGLLAQFDEVMEPWQGALPALFAATAPGAESGGFYGPDGDKEYAGYPAPSRHRTAAMQDPSLAQQLWTYAAAATHTSFSF